MSKEKKKKKFLNFIEKNLCTLSNRIKQNAIPVFLSFAKIAICLKESGKWDRQAASFLLFLPIVLSHLLLAKLLLLLSLPRKCGQIN